MDVFDIFFKKFAYKFPKGYPDMNNEQDVKLLSEFLYKLGMPTLEGQISEDSPIYNPFSYGEMIKPGRDVRAETIYNKINNGEPFAMTDGTEKQLEFNDPSYAELFKNKDLDKIKEIAGGSSKVNKFPFFKDENSKYGLQDLLKTSQLGGKGKGSGTKVEDAALASFKTSVEKLVQENNGPITVIVNGIPYKNIVTAETQQGTPKSDFNLIDSEGKPVVFISHKKASHKGASPDDFIRWGGFSEYEDENDVKLFIEKLKELMVQKGWDEIPRAVNFIKEIENDELAKKIVFGKDYKEGSKVFGKNNVTIAIQGAINLTPTSEKGTYDLTGEHYYYNGDNPTGDYRPVLTGKYRSDRTMFGIPKLEAIAQPAGVAHKSSNIYELKGDKFVQIKEKEPK